LSLILTWRNSCLTHHTTTCAPPVPVPLPTRLLNVTTDPPLLVEPTPGTLGAYLTLSHCWGPNPLITTTTSNLHRHSTTGLPLETLPPTFRDAILTTRALGHTLLWIDSLCILQDSRSDWAREAARMGSYFAECEIVLAAAHAAHSGEGLFRTRDAWGHQPWQGGVRMPGVAGESVPGKVRAWPAKEETVTLTREIGWDRGKAVRKGPLDGRAWTMQEGWLAQRVVRWEGFQVRWVCKGGEGCENWVGMREGEGAGEPWVRSLGGMGKGMERDLYMGWYRTVEEYTVRAITKQFDILPAIGGLASRFEELVQDRYVAGLWEGDLHQGLLWTVEGPIQPGEQRFRAPSWSWASVNLTSIKFGNIPKQEYSSWIKEWFAVDEVTTPLASANAYGEVDGGTLKARGYLRELKLAKPSVGGKVYGIRKNALLNPETGETLGTIFLDYPRLSTDPTLHVWCVPVMHAGKGTGTLSSVCLALVPTGSVESQEFKRVGLATITNKKWDQDFFPSDGKQSICIM
ncbi:heterokaryon incompatibility protein-domain-containing protein, partial [Staphylotrichum tortipilum]